MYQLQDNTAIETVPTQTHDDPASVIEYGEVLETYGLTYQKAGAYLQVGAPDWEQGWILHISVIMTQIMPLLKEILPFFIKEQVAFKVVKDLDTGRNLLDGHLGYDQLGKILTIYPRDAIKANEWAIHLMTLTASFKGPLIPTDARLGGCVYARYGGCNPIVIQDNEGRHIKLIHDTNGRLVEDSYPVPFSLFPGVSWPFLGITMPKKGISSKNIKGIYKSISTLKADARGRVFKAIYLKSLFRTGLCVIKEGKFSMCSDEQGRDIRNRLQWQDELHKKLDGIIPLPTILDFFQENENSYLAMEFIDGVSLHEQARAINGNCLGWLDLADMQKKAILDYLLKLISILEDLHGAGYVHRDVTPVNFLIDANNKIWLIDIELAYNYKLHRPTPPFTYGSPGFMSPEQASLAAPTPAEDVYGLCATMIDLIGGVPPSFLDTSNNSELEDRLYFLIGDRRLSRLIAEGLSYNPADRPNLPKIRDVLELCRKENSDDCRGTIKEVTYIDNIEALIQKAINSLTSEPILITNQQWLSKTIKKETVIDNPQRQYSFYPGLSVGVSGVTYVIARAKQYGFSVESHMPLFKNCWNFLHDHFDFLLQKVGAGLYNGSAGIAVALATCLKSELVNDNNQVRTFLQNCLVPEVHSMDLASGLSGQALATLLCGDFLAPDFLVERRKNAIRQITRLQKRNGSWNAAIEHENRLDFRYGHCGIAWFVLEYVSQYPEAAGFEVANRAMEYLQRAVSRLKKSKPQGLTLWWSKKESNAEWTVEVILTFMKAYSVLKNPIYRQICEQVLAGNPVCPVYDNFSQISGLAGIGEVYLEAYRLFGNREWIERAEWIAQMFLHTSFKTKDGNIYWIMDQYPHPSAELMSGHAGIVHFLMRFLNPKSMGYRMLTI